MFTQIPRDPAYWHVLLNHLPIFGTALGALALGVALALRSRPAQITALAVVLAGSAGAWPVYVTGERAYKPIRGLADDTGGDWLDEHMDRAEKTIPVFYTLAAVALAGIVLPAKWPRTGVPLAGASLALSLVCLVLAGYVAEAGGRIRHPEFRPVSIASPPP
jgi:hypothetical protein